MEEKKKKKRKQTKQESSSLFDLKDQGIVTSSIEPGVKIKFPGIVLFILVLLYCVLVSFFRIIVYSS